MQRCSDRLHQGWQSIFSFARAANINPSQLRSRVTKGVTLNLGIAECMTHWKHESAPRVGRGGGDHPTHAQPYPCNPNSYRHNL